MVETLEENHIKVDAHIKTMNDALSASRREFESVKTLMRQLYSARDKAFKDLQECVAFPPPRCSRGAASAYEGWCLGLQGAESGRGRRAQAQADPGAAPAGGVRCRAHGGVAQATGGNAPGASGRGVCSFPAYRLLQLSPRRPDALTPCLQLCGEMSKEEEERLMARLVQKQKQSEQLQQETAVKTREALTLQEAFLKIRQATGVATLEEMVDKFLGQGAMPATAPCPYCWCWCWRVTVV